MIDLKDEHHVHDSALRSWLIVLTANALEYLADVIFLLLIRQNVLVAFGGSVVLVIICFVTTFLSLRIWNEIKWGRKVMEMKK